MSLFRFQWLRRFVRKRTAPIPTDTAALWKRRLAIMYAVIAWNGFGLVCYMIYKGKGDWAKSYGVKSEEELKLTPGQQWAKQLGIKNATLYRVSGVKVTSREELTDDGDEKKQADNIST